MAKKKPTKKKRPAMKSAVGGALVGGKKIADPIEVEYSDKPDPKMYTNKLDSKLYRTTKKPKK